MPAGGLLEVYLNRLYADPVKPTKFANLVRRGLTKTPSCCRWHFTRMVREKRRMVMVMKTEERLLVNVLKARDATNNVRPR